jgi:hypothetical protein
LNAAGADLPQIPASVIGEGLTPFYDKYIRSRTGQTDETDATLYPKATREAVGKDVNAWLAGLSPQERAGILEDMRRTGVQTASAGHYGPDGKHTSIPGAFALPPQQGGQNDWPGGGGGGVGGSQRESAGFSMSGGMGGGPGISGLKWSPLPEVVKPKEYISDEEVTGITAGADKLLAEKEAERKRQVKDARRAPIPSNGRSSGGGAKEVPPNRREALRAVWDELDAR